MMDRLFSRERTEYGDLVYRFYVKLRTGEALRICRLIQDYVAVPAYWYGHDEIRVTDAPQIDEEQLRRLDVEIVAVLAYHLREDG